MSDAELLLETLADLTEEELGTFKDTFTMNYRQIPYELMESDLQDSVCLMLQTYGRQTVEQAALVLEEMERGGLALRLTLGSAPWSKTTHTAAPEQTPPIGGGGWRKQCSGFRNGLFLLHHFFLCF